MKYKGSEHLVLNEDKMEGYEYLSDEEKNAYVRKQGVMPIYDSEGNLLAKSSLAITSAEQKVIDALVVVSGPHKGMTKGELYKKQLAEVEEAEAKRLADQKARQEASKPKVATAKA